MSSSIINKNALKKIHITDLSGARSKLKNHHKSIKSKIKYVYLFCTNIS